MISPCCNATVFFDDAPYLGELRTVWHACSACRRPVPTAILWPEKEGEEAKFTIVPPAAAAEKGEA